MKTVIPWLDDKIVSIRVVDRNGRDVVPPWHRPAEPPRKRKPKARKPKSPL